MGWEDEAAVVFDNGSGMFKAGFAGDDAPKVVFGSLTGKVKEDGSELIGDAVLERKTGVRCKYPVEHGIVTDWDGLEKVWREAYKQLDVKPEDHAMMVTEAALNPKKNREKMLELAFESLQAPATHIVVQAVMTLYSAGKDTGCVVDIGDGVAHVVPLYSSHTVRNAIVRNETAGRDLTEWMMVCLSEDAGRPFTTSADREIARQIKEQTCYVSLDWEKDLEDIENDETCKDEEYTMPDGSPLFVGRPRFACPEMLFQPEIAGREEKGIHELIQGAIQECDIDIRKSLYSGIQLSGGTTMFENMEKRLQMEMEELAPEAAEVKVIAPSERKYSVWMGASILAGLASFGSQWITKQEYEEMGAGIVHRRCDSLATST